MNGMVKLTQSDGKALVCPASAIRVLESVPPEARAMDPKARCKVWLDLEGRGQLVHAILADQWGFLLRLTGGLSGRIQLTTVTDSMIVLPPYAVNYVIEIEGGTSLHTNLQSITGDALRYLVVESAEDIINELGIQTPTDEKEEDNGDHHDDRADPADAGGAEAA